MAEGYIEGVGKDLATTAVANAICAGCVAIGWSQTNKIEDPENWPTWAGLFIVGGAIGFAGTGVNAARLLWKKHRIGPSPGERLTVILANLVGDDSLRRGFVALAKLSMWQICWHVGLTPRRRLRAMSASPMS